MMYICTRCGELYDEDRAFSTSYVTEQTPYGRVRMARCDDLGRCEYCNGELAPTKHCHVCDLYIDEDGPDICDFCIENAETVDTAVKLGEVDKVSIEVNGFVARFGEDWINAMLCEMVKKFATVEDAKLYVNHDLRVLTDFLVDEKDIEERAKSEKGGIAV